MERATERHYSLAEYLERETQSVEKHEYHGGDIVAMAGGPIVHSLLASNAGAELRGALRGKSCRVYNADLQVALSRTRYVYPDVTVVCGAVTTFPEHAQAPNNPVLIIEVLSDSTEKYDRGEKFRLYRQIPTFREYVLIAQDEPIVEVYYKLEDNVWRMSTHEGLDKTVRLESIDVGLPLRALYLDVELDPDEQDTH